MIKVIIFPLIFYFVFFCILSFPLIMSFSTHFFADQFDGLQHVWNIWWVNKAITQLHQSPWQTPYLHYPHGISLIGHTLNPFNGFMGIILLKYLTLVEAYNFIVVFSFVIGGLTAFLLAYYISRSYWGSIIGGFIFTFSNYHFAHAEGHLNLVSLEWVPLFLLLWYMLITKPGIFKAIASGIVLFLVFLCDYYYFLYSVLAGCLVVIWYAFQGRDIFFLGKRKYLFPIIIFIFIVLLTTGPFIIPLVFLNIRDPLWGSHPSGLCSMDLLAPFIPGGHWHFANLTKPYWSNLSGNIHEASVYMGVSVAILLGYVWSRRRKFHIHGVQLWYLVLIFFFLMSLGPVLHIWGKKIFFIRLPYGLLKQIFPVLKLPDIDARILAIAILMGFSFFSLRYIWGRRQRFSAAGIRRWYPILILIALINLDAFLHIWGSGVLFLRLPYALFEKVFPFLKISGVPVRMMVMVMLSGAVICAEGFNMLFQKAGGRAMAAILLTMLFFEYLPKPMPASRIDIPEYIKILKNIPESKGVIDTVNWPAITAYYQTIHEKPIAFSDVSRIPESVLEKDRKLRELIQKGNFRSIYQDYNIGYLITSAGGILDAEQSIKMIYNDGGVVMYDLSE